MQEFVSKYLSSSLETAFIPVVCVFYLETGELLKYYHLKGITVGLKVQLCTLVIVRQMRAMPSDEGR